MWEGGSYFRAVDDLETALQLRRVTVLRTDSATMETKRRKEHNTIARTEQAGGGEGCR